MRLNFITLKSAKDDFSKFQLSFANEKACKLLERKKNEMQFTHALFISFNASSASSLSLNVTNAKSGG